MKTLTGSLVPLILIAAASLLLVSFTWSAAVEATGDQDADSNVANPMLAKMLGQPRKVFKSYSDVLQKLGKPKSVDVRKVPNIHDSSEADTVRTLTYPGLVIAVYQVPRFEKEFIIGVTLTKRQKKLRLPVTVGASRDFVISRLGQPHQDYGDTLIYADDFEELNIQFRGSKVSRIEWSYLLN